MLRDRERDLTTLEQREQVLYLGWGAALLPSHAGERRDLPLNRVAPADLAIAG